jgi:hypothetical protein
VDRRVCFGDLVADLTFQIGMDRIRVEIFREPTVRTDGLLANFLIQWTA